LQRHFLPAAERMKAEALAKASGGDGGAREIGA